MEHQVVSLIIIIIALSHRNININKSMMPRIPFFKLFIQILGGLRARLFFLGQVYVNV